MAVGDQSGAQPVQPAGARWERHLQSIVGFIVAGLIGWVGLSVSRSQTDVAVLAQQLTHSNITVDRLEVKVDALEEQLEKATARIQDTLTNQLVPLAHIKDIDKLLDDHGKRIYRLEMRFSIPDRTDH